jgi:hypothetical protein
MKKTTQPLMLILASAALLFVAPLLLRPVNVLRPVRTSTGEIVRRPNGRPQYQESYLGDLLVNRDAYFCFAGSAVCFVWALCSGAAIIRGKSRRDDWEISGWFFVGIAFVPSVVGSVCGLSGIAPSVPDHIDGWVVIVELIVALWSIVCFIYCPRRPLGPKIAAFCLCALVVYLAVDFLGIYYVWQKARV